MGGYSLSHRADIFFPIGGPRFRLHGGGSQKPLFHLGRDDRGGYILSLCGGSTRDG